MADYVRPSDYGPSFVFEISRTFIDECLFRNLYHKTFGKWIHRPENPFEWWQLMQHGVASNELALGVFEDFKRISIEIRAFPYENVAKINNEFYNGLVNDPTYHYVIIQMFKRSSNELLLNIDYRQEDRTVLLKRRALFDDMLKEWILELHPNFVWGDNFPLMKKYEPEDSRSRVWGYNFYSENMVKRIGQERFFDLVDETDDWYLEMIDKGILLMGDPDPYSMNGQIKNKARTFLQLKKQLAGIIKQKVILPSDTREAPPKGVIE